MADIALVLVDIQNDYFPGGRMALPQAEEAGRNAASLLAAFRRCGLPVIHVRHESVRPGSTFFISGTTGADIHPLVLPAADEAVVVKNFPNSFRGTDLEERLRVIAPGRLVVAGMMTNMCIDATVRAAFDLGFACRVPGDATAACPLAHDGVQVDAPQVRAAFLAALKMVYAEVMATADVLAAMEK